MRKLSDTQTDEQADGQMDRQMNGQMDRQTRVTSLDTVRLTSSIQKQEDEKKTTIKKNEKSNLIYNMKYCFYKYNNIKNIKNLIIFLLNQNIHF